MEQDINENIKILEESIIQRKYHLYKKDLKKCVSNLIKAYKELEEENKDLKNLANKKQWISSCYVAQNYIPVSLVEETIEERKLWLSSNDIGYKDDYVLEVLQELLEKRK